MGALECVEDALGDRTEGIVFSAPNSLSPFPLPYFTTLHYAVNSK